MKTRDTIHPVDKKHRIISLDVLRGFAVLGILIMNIQSFAMPDAAYLNPMAYGDMTGINKWVWILSHVFGDQKFMTIFSLLFGAGVVLLSENAERKSVNSTGLHYRRTFWLLVIGLIHAHLIWHGDILVAYAICALFVYLFRNVKPKTLLILGILLIGVHTIIYLLIGFSMGSWPADAIEDTRQSWLPAAEAIQEEISAYTGSFEHQLSERSKRAFFIETAVFLMIFLWRAGGLMLVGMALYKWGILSAKKSNVFYTRSFLLSFAIGLPIVIYGLVQNYANNWVMDYSMFLGSQFNYWGSLLIGYGYICLVMLMVKSNGLQAIKKRLAAVGQMALTNYLMQSIICVFVFYGIGFGLFGSVERIGQLLFVLGIWLLQLFWSLPWLKKFYFGPFEWAWRSLSYLKVQPFKK